MDESCFGEMMSPAQCRQASTTSVSPLSPHDPQASSSLAFTGVDVGGLAAIGLLLAVLGAGVLAMFGKRDGKRFRSLRG